MSLKKKKNNRLVENQIKKEPPKEPTKSDLREFNKQINKKGTSINRELFQKYFKFQGSSDMLKFVYIKNDRKKNDDLESLIKSGLIDFKNKIENMS